MFKKWEWWKWKDEIQKKSKRLKLSFLYTGRSLPVQMAGMFRAADGNPGEQKYGPTSRLPQNGELRSSTGSWWHTIRVCIFKVACGLLVNFPSLFWGMGIGGINRIWHRQTKDAFWSRHSLWFAVGCTAGHRTFQGLDFPSGKMNIGRAAVRSHREVWNPQPPSVSSHSSHLFPELGQGHVWSQDRTFGWPSGSRQPRGAV